MLFGFDFISAEFIVGLVGGFTAAAAMGRSKFNRVQTELREMEDTVDDLIDRFLGELDLNKGLQAELYDAAVPKAKRL